MPRQLHPLDQSPFYALNSRSKLARLLGLSLAELRALEAGGDELYSEFDIAKKSGAGFRHIENPKKNLKVVQARLARRLAQVEPPEFLFCPVKARCYVGNAAMHMGNRVVQCLDIKNFYPSVPSRRVFWFFHTVMGCARNIAGLLAKLTCYRGHLPTGSPASPILGYFAYFDLWQRISAFCEDRGHRFTVYVDDVTISGGKVPEKDVWEVRKMIRAAGLRYHKRKRYIDRPAEITGVIVEPDRLCAPHRQHLKRHTAQLALGLAREIDREPLIGRVAGITGQIQQIAKHTKAG